MIQGVPSKVIRIGVSACLLGQAVRYDGRDKYNPVVNSVLCQQFDCVPFCPEMAIGLGCPRPPVQLVKTVNGIRAIGRDDPAIEITDRLVEYSEQVSIEGLSGLVLSSRSPSCGVGTTPLFDIDHHEIGEVNGLFAEAILQRDAMLPVIEDKDLDEEAMLNVFIEKVKNVYLK